MNCAYFLDNCILLGVVSYKDNQKKECLDFITEESGNGLYITESVDVEFNNTTNRKHKILTNVSRNVLSGLKTDKVSYDDILDLQHKFNRIKADNKYPNDKGLIRQIEKDVIRTFKDFRHMKKTINEAQAEAYKKIKDIRRKMDYDINNIIRLNIKLIPNKGDYQTFEKQNKHKLNFINNIKDRTHILQSYKHGVDNKNFIIFVSTDENCLLNPPKPSDINTYTEGYVSVAHPIYASTKRYELERMTTIEPT